MCLLQAMPDAEQQPASEPTLVLDQLAITMADFTAAVGKVQPSVRREGFATTPDVTWADVGALDEVRIGLAACLLCLYLSGFQPAVLRQLAITMADFTAAVGKVQPSVRREGFATTPDVTWADVGALDEVCFRLVGCLFHSCVLLLDCALLQVCPAVRDPKRGQLLLPACRCTSTCRSLS